MLGAALYGLGKEALNFSSAKQANKFSKAEAQKNRDFQAHQSETVYQRSVKDLKKAGLNPILAAIKGGSPAMSGSAAAAHQKAPSSDGFSAYQQAKSAKTTRSLLAAQITNTEIKNANDLQNYNVAKAKAQPWLDPSTAAQLAKIKASRDAGFTPLSTIHDAKNYVQKNIGPAIFKAGGKFSSSARETFKKSKNYIKSFLPKSSPKKSASRKQQPKANRRSTRKIK